MASQNLPQNKIFRILSLDGGGVRGIFAAKTLALMATKLQINVYDAFDLIVGTSTGSIIAAAIAVKYDLSQLVDDYQQNASKIFQKRFNLSGLIRSKYDSKFLSSFLNEKLGSIKLGEIEKPLIINATNISIGELHFFKSSYLKKQRNGNYVRDGEVPLHKAVLASCSAPIYFDPVDIDGTLICDGGTWANNPSLVGYTDAIGIFQVNPHNIKILSLGTGQARQSYQNTERWGFLTGWKKTKLINCLMLCQTKYPQNVLSLINQKMIFRINPTIDDYELDNYRCIPTLIELAKSEFTRDNTKISNFLALEAEK